MLALIVAIGALVALAARRLRIPYTVGLVIAGILLALLHLNIGITLSKELIFELLLPPLIFEAAINIEWPELRRDLLPILVFATLGVLLSAGVTALAMYVAVGWIWPAAIVFGVLIAATDPVSVIATFKEAGVGGRLRLLVEAESLFNDSTAAVAFAAALTFAAGAGFSIGEAVVSMLLSVGGGIATGLIVGGLSLLIMRNTDDHLVELAVTSIAAFGSFWLAEDLHLSGILATTATGLLLGNIGSFARITPKGTEYISTFWDFAAFVVNSVIFVILGMNVAYQDFAANWLPILIAIAAVVLGRAGAVYPCAAIFSLTKRRIESRHQHIMFWGGLRGALALALALGIPAEMPFRQEVLTVTFGVVAFSVFVQGMTMTPLLRRLGQIK